MNKINLNQDQNLNNNNLQEVKDFYKDKILNDFIKPKKNVFKLLFKYLSIYILSIIYLIILNSILSNLGYSYYIMIISSIIFLLLSIVLFITFLVDVI